jgi:3-hydroxyacyl-CoA dehydrogenase / enoyl-CoA hydratase / 3-hydroxybutyryl-CoA epimerase
VADGNIGSIFGWGFAPFHGGALQFINAMGAKRFVERSRELAARYGARFEPAAVVVAQAETGGCFTD